MCQAGLQSDLSQWCVRLDPSCALLPSVLTGNPSLISGSLTTGKGNRQAPLLNCLFPDTSADCNLYTSCHRFVLANTETLHEKIEQLSHRVRSLEDALTVAHKAISSERHPLLSDELMRIKNPLERDIHTEAPRIQEEEDAIDAVGTL